MISVKLIFSTLVVLFGFFVSVPALAHSGQHSMNFPIWLSHILASPVHLLSLAGLSIFFVVATVLWRRLKSRQLSALHLQSS